MSWISCTLKSLCVPQGGITEFGLILRGSYT
jgi:hypothetical protein